MTLALVALPLAALCARMLLGARDELRLAERASAPRQRVTHLRRAMAYYLPLNPWVRRASDGLRNLARQAESGGDPDLALHAWRELRSAVLALRGAYQPLSGYLPEANRRVAALSARAPDAARRLTTAEGRARLLERLGQPPEPRPGWTAIGLAGFLLWVGGGIALLLAGLRSDATPTPRFYPLTALVAIGLLLFAIGMAQA